MPKNIELKRAVSRFSSQFTETLTGLILYQLAFGLATITVSGGKNSKTAGEISTNADQISDQLFSALNPEKISNAIYYLRRRGLINALKENRYQFIITKIGLKQLSQKVPHYLEKRPWNKRVYLINYDIQESISHIRKQLYKYLLEIKCAPLQKSTFISVYNPTGLIKSWVKMKSIPQEILISDLGPDGSLGERPLPELVSNAYHLPDLNNEYAIFLNEFPLHSITNSIIKTKAIFSFNSILTRDPQLPFELLPNDWLGDKAFTRYQKINRKNTL